MKITEKDILPFQFYTYKQPFTGSCEGMRYRIAWQEKQPKEALSEAEQEKPTPCFLVSVWKEPYAYEHTPQEEIEHQYFSFDKEGYRQALVWLNEKKEEYQ